MAYEVPAASGGQLYCVLSNGTMRNSVRSSFASVQLAAAVCCGTRLKCKQAPGSCCKTTMTCLDQMLHIRSLMRNAGNWALEVKRDYFNKVAGGVRQQEKLDAHSELVKIRYHTMHLMQQDHNLCACSVSTANALDSIAVSAKPALLCKTICHITRATVSYQELCWMPGIILERYAVPQLQNTSLTACTLQGNRAWQVLLQLDFTTASCHTHDCPQRVMLWRLMHVLPGLPQLHKSCTCCISMFLFYGV